MDREIPPPASTRMSWPWRGRARLLRYDMILCTAIGGSRELDLPVGELIPRIC